MNNRPLFQAIRENYLSSVERIRKINLSIKKLKSQNISLDDKNELGDTPLIYAATFGHVRTVKALLDAKADPDILGAKETALHAAAKNPNVNSVNLLIEAKANVESKDVEGSTPLIVAATYGRVPILKTLIAARANIDARYTEENTALTGAAMDGWTDCVETLIEAKADINAQNSDKDTALILAARYKHANCVDALIAGKAGLEIHGKFGDTALIMAAGKGSIHNVNALIEAKADINAKDNTGITPLYWAVENIRPTYVTALIKAKANLNCQTKDTNDTALINAVRKGPLKSVIALVEAKANLNIRNRWGRTALWVAVNHNRPRRIVTLLAAGADLTIQRFGFPHPRLLLDHLMEYDPRDPSLILALMSFCTQLRNWALVEEQKIHSLSDDQLKQTEDYANKLRQLTQLHKKNTLKVLDAGTSVHKKLPTDLLNIILDYDAPANTQLQDGRVDRFKVTDTPNLLKKEQAKDRLFSRKLKAPNLFTVGYSLRSADKNKLPVFAERPNHKRLKLQ